MHRRSKLLLTFVAAGITGAMASVAVSPQQEPQHGLEMARSSQPSGAFDPATAAALSNQMNMPTAGGSFADALRYAPRR